MQRNSPKLLSSHEDLEVYKIAFDAAMEIFELSKNFPSAIADGELNLPLNANI